MTEPVVACLSYLQDGFDRYAADRVAAATAGRDQQIASLQGQLAAQQALVSQDTAQLAAAQQQLAAAQTQIATLTTTVTADRGQLATDQALIASLQQQIGTLLGGKAPAPPPGYVVALTDDFTGPALNPANWTAANNDSSNNELSLRLAANAVSAGDFLSLRALRQTVGTKQFTSGHVSNGVKAGVIPFGRWLIRARWTPLFGLWPALWLRWPDNPDGTRVLGEIDIMEAVGGWPHLAETVHQSTNGDQDKSGFDWPFPAGWSPSDWHTYGLTRTKDGALSWSIDGAVTRTAKPTDLSTKLHQPMSWLTGPAFTGLGMLLRMNLQVGGSMPNSVLNNNQPLDPAKILPSGTGPGSLDIDWVQVLAPAA